MKKFKKISILKLVIILNNELKYPLNIANSARRKRYIEEQERLKSNIALGDVRKANRRHQNNKKLLRGAILVLAFSGLLASWNIAKDKKIQEGKITEDIVYYSPSAGPDINYYDQEGNEVKPLDIFKDETDTSIKR